MSDYSFKGSYTEPQSAKFQKYSFFFLPHAHFISCSDLLDYFLLSHCSLLLSRLTFSTFSFVFICPCVNILVS